MLKVTLNLHHTDEHEHTVREEHYTFRNARDFHQRFMALRWGSPCLRKRTYYTLTVNSMERSGISETTTDNIHLTDAIYASFVDMLNKKEAYNA